MPSHWTYEEKLPDNDLYQGDIIRRTGPLLKVLGSVHGYFCDEKYLGFIVVSQTCDLVMRTGECKAKYINLAVIRSLESMMPSFLQDVCGTIMPGVYFEEGRGDVKALIERIINQNEQALGLFYLEPDGDLQIAVESVVLLRVSIALRSREHYRIVQEARLGRLRPSFRNKLGWLTGNLYSRVDTPDWPEVIGKPAASKKVDKIFKDLDESANNHWVSRPLFQLTLSKQPDIVALPKEQLLPALQAHAPRPPLEAALKRLKDLTTPLLELITLADLEKASQQMRTNRGYAQLVADAALIATRKQFNGPTAIAFWDHLAADTRLPELVAKWMAELAKVFMTTRVQKGYPAFLAIYGERPIFDNEWLSVLMENAAASGIAEAEFDQLTPLLLEIKPTLAMRDCVRTVLQAAAAGNLATRLASRLASDGEFRGAFAARG